MIIYPNGYIETGEFLTHETYPDKTYFVVEENSDLARKILSIPYRKLIITDGNLVDVEERQPTPEEEAAAQTPKTDEQVRIEQLESENALIAFELADSQSRLELSEQNSAMMALELVDTQVRLQASEKSQADLILQLVDGGVL